MKAVRQFLVLFGFNCRLLPATNYFLVLLFSFNALLPTIFIGLMPAIISLNLKGLEGEEGSMVTVLNIMPFMFCGIIGLQFMIRETGWAGTEATWLMPAGEFLFTRPIRRRTDYCSRMTLYFLLLLTPFLFNLALTRLGPDSRIGFYHLDKPGHDLEELSVYQKQFPQGVLSHGSRPNRGTFLIPQGAWLVALWQIWIGFLFALALQATTLLRLPLQLQTGLFMTICFLPMFFIGFPPVHDPTAILETSFFFFLNHWLSIAFLTLVVFFLVQHRAWQRVQELEMG